MSTVRVIFSRKHAIGSAALRMFLWSPWSHCAIIDGSEIIEAAVFHGVRARPLVEFLDESSEFEIVEIPCSDPEKAIQFARDQIGKSYDYWGVIGFPFRGDWESADAWFCSELVGAAINHVEKRFRIKGGRLSPPFLYAVDFNPPLTV